MRTIRDYAAGLTLCLTCGVGAHCCLVPNPYLKRSVADNLLLEIKKGFDDGKTATKILSELRKNIPIASRLAIKKNMFGQTIAELSIERPWVTLVTEGQGPRVLTRSGNISPAQLIRDDVLATLATVFISKTADARGQIPLLAEWLNQQPSIFFSRFRVSWHDKNDIEIHDENIPLVTIRATYKTVFNDTVLTFLDESKEKDRLYATIDLRFGDQQIVLVPKISRGKIV